MTERAYQARGGTCLIFVLVCANAVSKTVPSWNFFDKKDTLLLAIFWWKTCCLPCKESRATLACLYRTSGRVYMLQFINEPYTLNEKSLNGPGKSMVTVLQKKFLVQWRNFQDYAAAVFSWVNQEIWMSSFQQGKYCGSKFRWHFSCEVKQIWTIANNYYNLVIFS